MHTALSIIGMASVTIDNDMKIRLGNLRKLVREALGESEYEGASCSECGGGMYEADEVGCEGMLKCGSCGSMEEIVEVEG